MQEQQGLYSCAVHRRSYLVVCRVEVLIARVLACRHHQDSVFPAQIHFKFNPYLVTVQVGSQWDVSAWCMVWLPRVIRVAVSAVWGVITGTTHTMLLIDRRWCWCDHQSGCTLLCHSSAPPSLLPSLPLGVRALLLITEQCGCTNVHPNRHHRLLTTPTAQIINYGAQHNHWWGRCLAGEWVRGCHALVAREPQSLTILHTSATHPAAQRFKPTQEMTAPVRQRHTAARWVQPWASRLYIQRVRGTLGLFASI